ncbi:Rpn family recombination-promoting nuclease/putative transposase [Heyndrickxia coagulans]|uniref:Rpn family recombination-promoting nuclease/putative transposase n=1 Tax=Heyndrickxia coagulans TaxID=1398 RepID=UPI001BE3EA39|nr:Rpn family recombination-promoting nuclease/putative transposase [Heyndrickxia coagulans]MBT2238312.1 Rpn family recombination-promoting nuclease/putative transposase [Heyndrickxia coagulans]
MELVMEKHAGYHVHDRLFKELIQNFFQEFMDAFFPDLSTDLDYRRVRFLSQEQFTDFPGGEQKRVDILAETKVKGKDTVILIHVEPQSYYEKPFPERMFRYYMMISLRHRKPVLPIAVFSYEEKTETPDTYTFAFHNIEILRFHYLSIHLMKQNWRNYIRSNNPVAAALLSKMGYTETERVQVKLEFLRMLARMELDPAKMRLLYGFFDYYLKLNEKEEAEVMENIKMLDPDEAEQVLKLPNSYFDRGYKKGKEEGREEGIEIGVEKGREEGIEIGVEKGREEERKEMLQTIPIAIKMLQEGMELQLIVEKTGLSQREVEKIKQQLEHS